jgi:hypothetical protein
VAPPAPEPSSWFTSSHPHSGSASLEAPPERAAPEPYVSFATPPSSFPAAASAPAKDEFLPIYAAVEGSSWFSKPAQTVDRRDSDDWTSPADQGWQAADVAAAPAQSGTTGSGLPKRTPRANLVPGTATPKPPPTPAPPLSPDRLRSRLASYQQGVRKGRSELEEGS